MHDSHPPLRFMSCASRRLTLLDKRGQTHQRSPCVSLARPSLLLFYSNSIVETSDACSLAYIQVLVRSCSFAGKERERAMGAAGGGSSRRLCACVLLPPLLPLSACTLPQSPRLGSHATFYLNIDQFNKQLNDRATIDSGARHKRQERGRRWGKRGERRAWTQARDEEGMGERERGALVSFCSAFLSVT